MKTKTLLALIEQYAKIKSERDMYYNKYEQSESLINGLKSEITLLRGKLSFNSAKEENTQTTDIE